MKVLLVSDYAPRSTGGAELGLSILRDGLRAAGHDARLFASTALPPRDATDARADYECFGTTSSFRTLLQTANVAAALRLQTVLAEFRPDVVHVNMFLTQLSPLILPVVRGLPALYHVSWHRPVCPTGLKRLPDGATCHVPWGTACYRNRCVPARDWPELMLQMHAWRRWRGAFDLVVAVSDAIRDGLVREGIGPVRVIRYGVPLRSPRPDLSDPPVVAFAGRFVPEKGVDTLVRAFARVARARPDAQLVLVGDGPTRSATLRLVQELGLSDRVALPGYQSREAIEQLFSRAWVQVVPSLWDEPFPLAGLEALMRGTALVASAAGGLPEMIADGETGRLFERGNDTALADCLLSLVQNRDYAERMGAAGRAQALQEYTVAGYVDRFLSAYQELADCRAGAAESQTCSRETEQNRG